MVQMTSVIHVLMRYGDHFSNVKQRSIENRHPYFERLLNGKDKSAELVLNELHTVNGVTVRGDEDLTSQVLHFGKQTT